MTKSWVSGFLFNNIRFDWEQFNNDGDIMTTEDFRVSEQPYCPREKVSKSITKDKLEVSDITLRLIEASVLEEVLEELEKNNASAILIGKVKLALR